MLSFSDQRTAQRLIVASAVGAAALGAVVGSHPHYGKYVVALAALGGVSVVIRRWGTGVWHAVLAAAVVNAIPGINLANVSVAHVGGSYVALCALMISLWIDNRSLRSQVIHGTARRWATAWCMLFLLMCFQAVVHVVVFEGQSVRGAFRLVLDIAPIAPLTLGFATNLSDSRRRNAFGFTMALVAGLTAGTEALAAITGNPLSFFVHLSIAATTELTDGVSRVFSYALDLVYLVAPIAIGYCLFGNNRRVRRWNALLAAICIVDISLALTRALYIGMIVGLALSFLIWLAGFGDSAGIGRRRLASGAIIVVVAVVAIAVFHPSGSLGTKASGVVQRVTSTVSAVGNSQDSADTAVRLLEAHTLEQALGDHWLLGLGFDSRFFSGLPEWDGGGILDSDVGSLGLVMTIGIVGAFAEYALVLGLGWLLVARRLQGREHPNDAPISFGITVLIVTAVISSVTFDSLSSSAGDTVIAIALGMAVVILDNSFGTGVKRATVVSQ